MERDHDILRWAVEADHDELADVMFDAVRHGRSRYTEAQRAQWVPRPRRGEDWHARLSRQAIAVASDGPVIVGFMSLDAGGYIDFAYIRPDRQGSGLFRRLFDRIEALAVTRGEETLRVHASLTAEPAFAAVGFEVVERQTVELGEERLDRAEMTKRLSGDPTTGPRQPLA